MGNRNVRPCYTGKSKLFSIRRQKSIRNPTQKQNFNTYYTKDIQRKIRTLNQQMKTIEFRNKTGFEDYFFKIIVNGEEYVMNNQFLTIKVPDDNSYEIKVENSLNPNTASNSFVYKFNQKENVVLLLTKRRFTKTLVSFIIGFILILIISFFLLKGRFSFLIPVFTGGCTGFFVGIRTKKLFFIQEIPKG